MPTVFELLKKKKRISLPQTVQVKSHREGNHHLLRCRFVETEKPLGTGYTIPLRVELSPAFGVL